MMKLWSSGANECQAETGVGGHDANIKNQVETRRRNTRLSSEQVDALERSFQEEIELGQQLGATVDERKMKLSRDLGMHFRQVAVWYQNRRARLKRKKTEQLYNVLKHDFGSVSRENQHLQQEVINTRNLCVYT
ncbi:hypothetical protein MKX01_007050 [Papaver californicum]|nr:hypothetical protein MKX01_007050 [Papaver californicum]